MYTPLSRRNEQGNIVSHNGYRYRQLSSVCYDTSSRRGITNSYSPDCDYESREFEIDISKYTTEYRFKYVEDLIIWQHKCSFDSDVFYIDCRASFDDWKDKVEGFKDRIHNAIVDYYKKLNFVERYELGSYSWIQDKDIVALIQVLQVRGRAKAAAKLKKLEDEIDSIAEKIAKVESGGRYYCEDVIKLTASFDRLRIQIWIENDRGRKRQETIDKIADAPFRAVAKIYKVGSNVMSVILFVGILLAIPFTIVMFILGLFGVVK
jgi:hypothetical protein